MLQPAYDENSNVFPDTAQALVSATDARDAAIVRAQSLAALVKSSRAALAILTTEAQAATMDVSRATDGWAAAMCDHVVAVHAAASSIALQCKREMDDAACDAVLDFNPNEL